MTDGEQTELNAYAAATTTEPVVQTVILSLETSQRKNDLVQQGIDEFQAVCRHLAVHLPSIPPHEWEATRNTTLYRLAKRGRIAEGKVYAAIVREATTHVVGAFKSARERGEPDPRTAFGDGQYVIVGGPDIEVVENDRGYGLRPKLVIGEDLWFHHDPTPYTERYLNRVVDGEASIGAVTFRLDDEGLRAHVPVKWEVDVYEPADVSTVIGVDLGENVLYAAAAVTDEGVGQVKVESGREYRHYRERLKQKRAQLMQQGDRRGVLQCRDEHARYTKYILDVASREIVDLAADHKPSVIGLEDLTHYRETADDPIHDWPYADLQEKIAYKATAAGIPVVMVDPYKTSQLCRHCGQASPEYRNGATFHCTRCEYEVHADVNGAINIAQRQLDE